MTVMPHCTDVSTLSLAWHTITTVKCSNIRVVGIWMPVYEYVCKDCDSHFDTLDQRLDQADQVHCGSCESGNVRRLVSSFATLGGRRVIKKTRKYAGPSAS